MFTKQELSEYRGVSHDGKLYLAILGQVFDVTKGAEKYYGG
jgi:predicted heme/steroid binding protein